MALNAVSQERSTYFQLKGYVISKTDSSRIPFAHIFNESTRTSAISGTTGFFSIRIKGQDSIVFSSVNHFPRLLILEKGKSYKDSLVYVTMKARIYGIEAVSIFRKRNYGVFREEVLALDMPKTEIELVKDSLVEKSKEVALKAYEELKTNQMLSREPDQIRIATVPIYSREEKERRKLKKVIEKEKIRQRVHEKFNKSLIQQLTGLEGPELTEFFVYLDFSDKYVLKTRDYDIRKRIMDKFELYLKEKKQHEQNGSHLRKRKRCLPPDTFLHSQDTCFYLFVHKFHHRYPMFF